MTAERDRDRHVARAEEAVADRVDEKEDRVDVADLLPRRRQQVDRVEDAAEEAQRQDQDVVDEAGLVPRLGVDADDDAQEGEEDEQDDDRQREHERLAHRHVGDGEREDEQPAADRQRAHDAADREPEVDLPRAHRRRQHVVDVAVRARLVDRRRVVGVRRLRHRHRDEAGHDEDVVLDAADLADAPAERQPEDDDEQKRREHRRRDRLRPELEHAVGLAQREREQPAVAIEQSGHRFEARRSCRASSRGRRRESCVAC